MLKKNGYNLTHGGEDNPMNYQKYRDKISKANSGELNPFFGKKHTDEYKRKSSESRKGKYHGKQNKPILIDNIEYKSLGDAENNLDIKKGNYTLSC